MCYNNKLSCDNKCQIVTLKAKWPDNFQILQEKQITDLLVTCIIVIVNASTLHNFTLELV